MSTNNTPINTPINTRVGQYIQVRDRIAEMKDRHEAELKPLNDVLLRLSQVLLDHMTADGVDSISVRGVGSAYRSLRRSASVADAQLFKDFVRTGQHFELVDWRANAPAVEAYINAQGMVPPGVNFRQIATVGVRRDNQPVTELLAVPLSSPV